MASGGSGAEEGQAYWQTGGKDRVSHDSYGPQHPAPQCPESNLAGYTHAPDGFEG